jgi:tetratricopeptide (TPR) repeat protein
VTRPVASPSQDPLAEKLQAWHINKSAPHAADAVSAAVVLGRTQEVKELADFLLTSNYSLPKPAIDLAILALQGEPDTSISIVEEPPTDEQQQRTIHAMRTLLSEHPRNAIMWVDLARQYAALGLLKKADKAMRSAISLAPNSRFVLRSAARFFVHNNEPDRAHHLLANSSLIAKDPWIMGAEIAVSQAADLTPRSVRSARRLLEAHRFAPRQTSELSSALATLELSAGKTKVARQHFGAALIDPTENSVAQATWASPLIPNLTLDPSLLDVPRSFEARAWHHFSTGDYQNAIYECEMWLNDEPFSARPATLGSFIATVCLDHFQKAQHLARRGLTGNPTDPLLRNNLVYALAQSAGTLAQAVAEYGRIRVGDLNPESKIAWTATGGALAFRKGSVEEGRRLYQAALILASKSSKTGSGARVLAFWAREEALKGNVQGWTLIAKAKQISKGISDPGTTAVMSLLDRIQPRLVMNIRQVK